MNKPKSKKPKPKTGGKGSFTVRGFKGSAISSGIKKSGKKDLSLIVSDVPCAVSGVFTRNIVKAAPVTLCQKRLKRARSGGFRGVVFE